MRLITNIIIFICHKVNKETILRYKTTKLFYSQSCLFVSLLFFQGVFFRLFVSKRDIPPPCCCSLCSRSLLVYMCRQRVMCRLYQSIIAILLTASFSSRRRPTSFVGATRQKSGQTKGRNSQSFPCSPGHLYDCCVSILSSITVAR